MNGPSKTLADVGELAFIERIREMAPRDGGLFVRSVGDDCLVTQSFGDDLVLSTTDTFVDGVHFSRDFFTFEQIGARCMTAAVSDIAAMSGLPVFSLLSLSMPGTLLFDDAVALFVGLKEAADLYRCPIVGGETTSTPGPVTITVTVTGRVEPGREVNRSGARPGDRIYITGTIGDSMAGLKAYQNNDSDFEALKAKFRAPDALVDLSCELSDRYGISSMIDVSDGVATDLGHICDESGCGAEVDISLLPLSNEFSRFAKEYDLDAVDFALSSGEEFELLFTSGDDRLPDESTLIGRRITRIGMIAGKEHGLSIRRENGEVTKVKQRGYEHFTSGGE